MSALRTRAGKLLLALYPEPWRERYGEEVGALLEDDPPGARGLASLLVGAAGAHVRPRRCWREDVAPPVAMRLSIGALFACWIAVSVAGSGFAKLTEHMNLVEDERPLMAAAHELIVVGAGLGAAAVAVGGLPLVWHALRTAARGRDRRLALMLASPAIAAIVAVAAAAVLTRIAPGRHGGFPAAFVAELLVPATLGVLGCALVAALAPKAVMRRSEPPASLLRLAAWAGQVLAGAIVLVALGMALYLPEFWSVPGAAGASGPFGLSTRLTLCLSPALALLATGPALLACARARRAALTRV